MPKCSNCQCDIEESKLFLHERFCKENIKYCDICKEAIIKEEFEEHLLEHDKKNVDIKPEEERSNLSLQRVMSTKIQCQYCNLLLSYSELEEHENMCGARTTKCKICGERIMYKDLDNHILAIHGLNKSIYNEYEYDSSLSNQLSELSLNKDQPSYQDSLNLNNNNFSNDLGLYKLTSSEQIAYALALSEQDNNNVKNKNENKDKEKNDKQKEKEKNEKIAVDKNNEKNELEIPKKKSEKIDYDEIENEYQKQMYEEEMKNFGNN